MRKKLLTTIIVLLASTSAFALQVKSPTRVLDIFFLKDSVNIQICNHNGRGCLTDEISESVIEERVQKRIDQLDMLVNDPAYQEEVKNKMLKEVETTGKAAFSIPGVGELSVTGSAFLNHLFNRMLPQTLKRMKSANINSMFSNNLAKYLVVKDKEITVSTEKEFGKFLDDITSELIIELK